MRLSHRYIPARQLPDKAVSLLDTACARVAVSQHAVPAEVDDCRTPHRGARDRAGDHRPRRPPSASTPQARVAEISEKLDAEKERAGRAREALERGEGAGRQDPRPAREAARRAGTVEGTGQQARSSGGATAAAARPRSPLAAADAAAEHRPSAERARSCSAELKGVQAELAALQGESPLILPSVDDQAVATRGGGLDRHPGRPHGEERDRDRSSSWPTRSSSASSASATRWR
ncbi:MAG: hypothetical protein MZV70_62755 [Desulfobacterales bacterium]|nr:hypothetical protein [Desulfobacterales bacterium]